MPKEKFPSTQAIRILNDEGVAFSLYPYNYEKRGGTARASQALDLDEHLVVKTLVMEDEANQPFLVLMHGDREVSTKALARALGVKTVRPCSPESAQRHTGYLVGGISPFGTKRPLRVYAEASVMGLPRILINGGKRGLLAEISPADLGRILNPVPVEVAV